jgi:sodium/potassium-transporting ATPase subunit alpha
VGDEHRIPLEDLLGLLNASPSGLTSEQAATRVSVYGANRLSARGAVSPLVKFLRQFGNLFAVLLMVGGGLSLVAEWLDPGQGNLHIAIALFAVVVLNSTFTFVQEYQSDQILASFSQMLPPQATVLRDGRQAVIEANELVPGDVILLAEGDRISADGRLLDHATLKVDLSSLTGESEPQLRHLECTHERLLESRNMVFSGTLVQSGAGRAVVYATGMNTQIGKIVSLTKETAQSDSPIHRELHHFIRIISTIAAVLGVLFFGVSVILGKGVIPSLIFAIGIIVANVPEGLLPTVTLALTMTSKRMAARHALVRNLESVEALGSTTVICTDKTGTLTQNCMRMRTVLLGGEEHAAWDRDLIEVEAFPLTLELAAACNNAFRTEDGYEGDPTEVALLQYAHEHDVDGPPRFERVAEEPFDSATKRMITLDRRRDGDGYRAAMKGAPEVVIAACSWALVSGELLPMDEARRERVAATYRRLAARSERVLALAYRDAEDGVVAEDGYVFVAVMGMLDPPRPEVPDALERCRDAGIRVIMITGDSHLTAEALARQVGLIRGEGCVVRGPDLEGMDEAALEAILCEPEVVFARATPVQKLRVVQALQRQGEVVTVTGDGVNDAPALKNADMGVSMGIMGTEVAKEASDMVLMDDNFATIVAAVEEGRTIFANIRKFVAYILTSNVPEITPFLAYVLLDIPLPLTVVLILAIDLGTDVVPALGLGSEPPETDVMSEPPRPRDERLLTPNVLFMSYGIVGVVQATAGFVAFFTILNAGGWSWGEVLANDAPLYRTAVSGFFAAIIVNQVADVLICRTRRASILTVGVFTNRLVWLGIACELALLAAILYVPALNRVLGTAPLELWQLAIGLPFAALILLGDELRRYLVRSGNAFVLRRLTW